MNTCFNIQLNTLFVVNLLNSDYGPLNEYIGRYS